MRNVVPSLLLALAAAAPLAAEEVRVPQPGPRDTCPVCGMFVGKYPQWVATASFKDGHVHHFDGAKDLFKFLFALPRYAPGHKAEDLAVLAVTEYYDLRKIDPRGAWFVVGSDTRGPMGHELVPLSSQADAEEFVRDHGGRVLRFREVTPELPALLDKGVFR